MTSNLMLSILILTSLILLTNAVCKDSSTLTDDERTIVEEHNKIRRKHKDTPDLCYGVSGDDVTFTADSINTTQTRDFQYRYSTEQAFGENKGDTERTVSFFSTREAFANVVGEWYEYLSGTSSGYQSYAKQVIWRNTKQVNCGFFKRKEVRDNYQTAPFYRYKHYILCQYFPPGNKHAGAANIGQEVDNIGELTCTKPIIENAKVSPNSSTVFVSEHFDVKCDEGFKIDLTSEKGYESSTTRTRFTCTIDGSLTPSVDTHICAKSDKTIALSMLVLFFSVLAQILA